MHRAIKRLLIANRGEIASRIIRSAKQMGIETIAVYAQGDAHLPYVRQADQAIALHGQSAQETYLQQEQLIRIALSTSADAIHPGYGFLAENAHFAKLCQQAGLIFVGPAPQTIQLLGNKAQAKALAEEVGVPCIPGYRGKEQSVQQLAAQARKIGFPLLLKAEAGGGGKGMRVVWEEAELLPAIEQAQSEALSAFADSALLIERYFTSVRHIEVQIFGDAHGQVVHLGERECSLQRRHQKIIEESPSPALDEDKRQAICQAALSLAKAVGYQNAGTVEFILTPQGEFFFLEVNTRLQVEHPVTEMRTGLDLVEWQLLIAQGQALPLKQEEIQFKGYAIECRLCAEDPDQDFAPSIGKILAWPLQTLPKVRYELGFEAGNEIGIFFDSMLAKVIAWGEDRASGQRRLHYALSRMACLGLKTNLDYLLRLLDDPAFQQGDYDTQFLHRHGQALKAKLDPKGIETAALLLAAAAWWERRQQQNLLPQLPGGWRNNPFQAQQVQYQQGETIYTVHYRHEQGQELQMSLDNKHWHQVEYLGQGRLVLDGHQSQWQMAQDGDSFYLHHAQYGHSTWKMLPRYPLPEKALAQGAYIASMPAVVLKVLVEEGQTVAVDDTLLILSSMKMETRIKAHSTGKVSQVLVKANEQIPAGTALVVVEP